MMGKILFAWDFHGVLEKGNEYAVQEVFNTVMKEFGINRHFTIEDVKSLYGLSFADYYRHFFPDYNDEKIQLMVNRSREFGREAASRHVKPMDHVEEVLGIIQQKGHENIIVSNTTPKMLEHFISLAGIGHLVNASFGVHTNADSLSKTKHQAVMEYAKGRDFSRIIFIGDTERDIEAGLACNAKTYLFSTNPDKISITKAHRVISDLRDVLDEI